MSDGARRAAMQTYWRDLRARCRVDVNTFIETVFKNDQAKGSPAFRQQDFHREWQAAWGKERIVVIHGATGFGKTEQVLGRLLFDMGNDPMIRILIGGKSDDKANELLGKLKRQIEHNETLRAIFPELRPGEPWGAETIRLASAGIDTTTNTVTTFGISSPKAGHRADRVLLDDVNDNENTRTEDRRNYINSTADSVVQTRLTTNGRLWILANAWDLDDLAFTYSRRPGVWYGCYPAYDSSGRLLWPDFRPKEWLDKVRDTMSPTEFARMFLCQPRDEGTRIFKGAWFELARTFGAGLKPLESVRHKFDRDGRPIDNDVILNPVAAFRDRMRVVVGVDLATGKTEKRRKSDFTVLFVLGVRADGKRQVLWIERGRWDSGETIRRMRDIEVRYRPDLFVVEDNGAQTFLMEHARGVIPQARIEPFTTTSAKWDPSIGIESIGIELQAGSWIIPDARPESLSPSELEARDNIALWEKHLLDFSRTGHTPDDVMASWFAQRRAATLEAGVFSPTVFQQAQPDAFAAQFPPLSDPDEIEVPAYIRSQFGL